MTSAGRTRGAGAPPNPRPWGAWLLAAATVLSLVWGAGCSASVTKTADSPEGAAYLAEPVSSRPQRLAAGAPPPANDFGSGFGDESAPSAEPAAPAPSALAAQPAPELEQGAAPPPPSPPPPMASEARGPAGELDRVAGNAAFEPTKAKARQPLLIYTAVLRLAVYRADPGLAQAEKIALDAGGYLVRRDNVSIVVRVPAARFKEVVHAMEQLGDVLGREIEAQDVTEEFFDLDTRLRNARAMRDRLQQLLERASTVEDALRVEQELGRLTGEIERLEGRLKLLRELLAFSTVKLEFQPRAQEVVSARVRLPFPWLDELGLGRLLDLGGGK